MPNGTVPLGTLDTSCRSPRCGGSRDAGGTGTSRSARMLGIAAVALLAQRAGIYPEGHFDKVHKCTESNFDDLVKTSVDAGKTLFVRWIASEG